MFQLFLVLVQHLHDRQQFDPQSIRPSARKLRPYSANPKPSILDIEDRQAEGRSRAPPRAAPRGGGR